MASNPDDLLSDAAVDAAVSALAERNAHHFEQMDEEERAQAVVTWRDIAVAVLTAARAVAAGPEPLRGPADGGRAVIVLEDVAPDLDATESEIAVHASFFPRLEEGDHEGEVLATPAQAAALELLDGIAGDDPLE